MVIDRGWYNVFSGLNVVILSEFVCVNFGILVFRRLLRIVIFECERLLRPRICQGDLH